MKKTRSKISRYTVPLKGQCNEATPAANLAPVSLTPVANNGNNIRLQIP
jgi:hypothetical protein